VLRAHWRITVARMEKEKEKEKKEEKQILEFLALLSLTPT